MLPLGNYGGPTQTMLPMPGSSAICAGIYSDVPGGVTTDQRTFPIKSSCVDAGAVQSNYIAVTSGADDATGVPANCPGSGCELRDAVSSANAAGDADIDFSTGVSTVTLTSAGPATTGNVNVVGPGANSLTITGQNEYALLSTSGGSAFLYGMTFANGSASTGGAIYNQDALTLSGMSFTGNTATTAGGAIYNQSGTVTVLNSSFTNNTAPNGSALYNHSTSGAVTAEYSTFANNTAATAAAVYTVGGAPLSLYNTTLSGNTGGGIDFAGSSALVVENSILGESTECTVSGGAACPTTGTLGNVVTPTNSNTGMAALSAPGSYSGTNTLYSTQSVLPEPGSSAICAGSATLIPSGISTDQRGFSNENLTYTGYSSGHPCVDAGAVQTNYTSAQFVGTPPYAGTANTPGTTPPVIVSVTENSQNVGGVQVPLTFSGTGTATGLTATTVEGTGATFSSINVPQPSGGSPDTLSTSMTVVGTDTLTAGPVNLTMAAGTPTPPTITSANSATFTTGASGTFTVTASGYPASTFSGSGTLPSGVSLTTAGVLSGTPAAGTGGSYPITITASNGNTPNATQSFTLTVNQTPAITSANTTSFAAGTAGTFTVTATGYPAPTFTETGTLPSGVTLTTAGVLSGTPAAGSGGSYPITITASNGVSPNATQSFTLTVSQTPAITSASTTSFAAGTAGTFTVTATGYPAPTFTETGTLPSGVTLTAAGVLSGTPAAGSGGSYPITITAQNGNTPNATQSFTLTVTQPPAFTSASTTSFAAGTAGTFTVTATGYPAPTFTETGTLPSGVTLTTAGVLSGTPAAGSGGSYPITITASNGVSPNATQSFTLAVSQTPAITSASTTSFAAGTAGTFTVTATGYPAPTFTETGTLPSGVTLTTAGVLSGTPAAGSGGSYPITITASNGNAPNATQSFTLTVNQTPVITSASTTSFAAGTAGTFTVTATGYPAPTFTETGPLPSGVTLTTAGVLSGTPAAGSGGSYPITITAQNGNTPNATQSFTLTVNQTPAITSASTTSFAAGTAGTFTVTATGYPAPTFTETGTLPSGVTLTSGGVLSGTPAAGSGGSYPVTITAQNGNAPNATQSFTLTVNQTPAITSASTTSFAAGTAGTFTVTATGYPAPTFTETGPLPSGVTLTSAGVLSGTPAAGSGGSYPITITAQNGNTPNATQSFTLTVTQPPAITSASSAAFALGTAGTFTVTATGYPAPTFTETGTLPSGVTLTTAGVLSGTPAAGSAGAYPITITAQNGNTPNATQSFTLTVNQTPAITSASTTSFAAGTAGTFTVTATGYPAPTFTETGTLPSGVTLTTAGVLSGTPAAGSGGSYPITITASNGVSPNATQSFTLTVSQTPAITSASTTSFAAGTAGTFTVTATGYPAPTFTETGPLPSGVTLTTAGVLSGTPAAGTGGSYPITITAQNGNTPNATQSFTLTVSQTPAITSASTTSFAAGTAGTFTVTATGYPAPTFTETGPLPSGVTLTTAGVLSGTPAAGSGGSYPITITASNGNTPNATQSFTLTVTQPPAITSASSAAFALGTAGTFTVTATGYPAPTFTETGTLPSGVTLTTAGVLSGTPAAGSGGTYPITITAQNGSSPNATQSFTLTIGSPTPIVPYIQDVQANSGAWQGVSNLSVTYGDTVNIGPQPASGGSWSWTGPNGFTATSREIDHIALPSATNVYTATYTNSIGLTSTQVFTITISPTPIVPYVQDLQQNGGAFQQVSTLAANYGDTVNIGPQPASGGSWSWTGPNGFTASTRAISGIALPSPSNVYTATYTNPAGATSTQAFTITVNPTPIVPYIEVNGGAWQSVASVTVNAGSTVNLGPAQQNGGSWSWTGPNGFTSTSRELDAIALPAATNVYTATYTNPAGATSTQTFTISFASTPIVPYIQDLQQNGGAFQQVSTLAANYGDTVNIGPQPASGGSWSWTGPNGFTASTRAISGIALPSPSNVYTATYTNPQGATSTQAFTITVNPTPIVPYIEVNGGAWQSVASVTVNAGSTVNLGPAQQNGGSWSWTGPNGFTSTSRELDAIALPAATNVYTATYTNPAGATSTQTFTISFASTPIVPYIQDLQQNGGAYQQAASLTANYGDTVNIGPQPSSGGSWSWTGPNGFTSTSRELDAIALPLPSNVYTATYTNPQGATSTQAFTITISPTPIVPYIQDLQQNGGAFQQVSTLAANYGDTVNIGPQPASGGSWSWTGPNGFTASTRAISGIALPSPSNVYTATYTNPAGATSTQAFTITVNPTPIVPYIEVNGGAWQSVASVTVNAGSTVNLGPAQQNGGSWSWTGPNGFTSTSRELDAIALPAATNVYTATYTNPAGATSTQTFTISFASTPIVPYIQDLQQNGGAYQQAASLTANYGDTVNIGPQPSSGGSWSWTGPNGFTSTSRELDAIALPLPSNVYTATYTNPQGATSTQAFTITISPTPIVPYIDDLQQNGGAYQQVSTLAVNYGDTVDIAPWPQTGGSWSWIGPNGFTSNVREIDSIPLASASNVFTATYTNPAGVTSTQAFTITVNPTTIAPYLEVDGGAWQNAASVTVNPGDIVNLGPQPQNGGSWSWSGPNGFSSNAREIDNIPLAVGTNTYVATYTNQAGVTSSQIYVITLN